MSGLFGSITIKGNRLTDFAGQTATVGTEIPYGFGRFPVDGNVIFASLPPKESVKKKKQGKGGVKTEEYSYTLSYAIAFCEGPIAGFLTIKRNGKIVWTQDPEASVEDLAYAAKWAQKATFYFGTDTQLPDSTIESYKGSGNVSAFRDLAYIVLEDDDVTQDAGAVPSYEAVVIRGVAPFVTTPPYPVLALDSASVEASSVSGDLRLLFIDYSTEIESANLDVESIGGQLRSLIIDYSTEVESASLDASATSGLLKSVVITYATEIENASLDASSTSGVYKQVVIPYNNYQVESASLDASAIGGSLA